MNWKRLSILIALSAAVVSVSAGAKTEQTKLVFAGYPDPAEFLIADVLRRVGDAYEEKNPHVQVEIERGLGYLASRKLVLEGKATGMMISEMLNEPRAYQTQHAVSGAKATYDLKMNKFLPVAVRVIRSKEETLARIRLGIVTDRVPDELRSFLDFLASEEARGAIAELEHVELARPAEKPEKIKEVYYKRKKVTLEQPILSY